MFRGLSRLIAAFAAVVVLSCSMTGSAFAAVEVNSADQSQLESVKGIGPSLSTRILAARKQSAFKDWSDLQTRVSGIGEKNSSGFSRNGLTVAGRVKDGVPASADAGRASKTASKKPATEATTVASSARK